MNFKTSIFSLLLFIFVSSGAFAQYKYDIGLKISSYNMEVFQLEQRFHLDNPYSIVVTLATGSQKRVNRSKSSTYNDSLFDATSNEFNTKNTALKVGAQRKLSFLATDVFYVGAAIGIGYEQQANTYISGTYYQKQPSQQVAFGNIEWGEVSSNVERTETSSINAQIAFSLGMDVPITKHFSINVELGFAALYEKSFDYPTSFIYLNPSISGGLRYSLFKRE